MKQLIFILLTALCLSACKKDEIDPRLQILGKWEIFYLGNGESQPQYPASGYEQYLSDSVWLYYDYKTKQTSTAKYWFANNLLYLETLGYEYDFQGDTLRLRVATATAINFVSKYKRIN